MATAIASVATGKPVSDQVAMTGEITLSGQVLPIGGLREKVLAASRADIPKVIFPRENEPDLEELPEEIRKELEFVPVDWIEEVLRSRSRARCRRPRPRGRSRRNARPLRRASCLQPLPAG